ncbi:hypothetical protein R8G61_02785 [Tenacibaculum maritimum]
MIPNNILNQIENKMVDDLKKLNNQLYFGVPISKSLCNHPKENQVKNKLGMIGCTRCNTWLTPYHRKK